MSACLSTSANGATAMPRPASSAFSASRSCETASEPAPGKTGTRAARNSHRRRRDVLEFVGDDVDRVGEGGERRLVVIGGDGARRATSKAGLFGSGQ